MQQDRSGGERFLECFEGESALIRETPDSAFPGKACKQKDSLRVVADESAIEVCEAQEQLNVSDFPRFRPILYTGDFGWVHGEAIGGQYETKVFNQICIELTFVSVSIKSMLSELSEYLADMLSVIGDVVRVDQYVVQVNHYRDVKHVRENVVHEMLEGGRCIRKSERHNVPFEGAIAGAERCFPFIAIGDADQVICMSEINLGVNPGLPGGV